MKSFFYCFIAISFFSCASVQNKESHPFKISNPSYNLWFGGQPGVSGVRIIMPYESSEKVEFRKIFFNNKEGQIDLHKSEDKTYLIGNINTGNRNGESLILDIDSTKEMGNEVPQIVNPPIQLNKNEAALVYVYKGKEYYYKVINLKKTETDFYP